MVTICSPQSLLSGMNRFLASLEITFRRDPTNFRPRVNKKNSVKDREQKCMFFFFFKFLTPFFFFLFKSFNPPFFFFMQFRFLFTHFLFLFQLLETTSSSRI